MEESVNAIHLEELQRRLKKKFPELKNTDLLPDETSKKDMIQMMCYKLRKTKNEMSHIIQFL